MPNHPANREIHLLDGRFYAEDPFPHFAWLRAHPRSRTSYRLIRSSAGLVADHEAPTRPGAGSTAAFW